MGVAQIEIAIKLIINPYSYRNSETLIFQPEWKEEMMRDAQYWIEGIWYWLSSQMVNWLNGRRILDAACPPEMRSIGSKSACLTNDLYMIAYKTS